MNRFLRNRTTVASLAFLALITLLAIAAPWVTRWSYEEQNVLEKLQGPSWRHWMGTDTLGRDLYSRIVYGARMSLAVGVATALFALVAGTATGLVAGYRGGRTDRVLMGAVDLFYIFPSLLLAILMMLLVGRGFFGILLALGMTSWVTQARLVRAQAMQARELAYVEAARAIGVQEWAILAKHILPNLWGPILVSLTAQIPTNIMAESFLSFIGLGLQAPFSSWGTLANEGYRAIRSYPYLMIFPGLILWLTLLAFNYLGEGLRSSYGETTSV